MTEKWPSLPKAIEVYEVGPRRLYAKTSDRIFAIFEDDLSPEELIAIAKDIAARRSDGTQEEFVGPSLEQV
jgi:hypothetical protein